MVDQDRIIKINIEEEMKSAYIDYSMSVNLFHVLFLMLGMALSRFTAVFYLE